MNNIQILKKKILIIPTCTDFNRGDQALVLETRRIIDQVHGNNDTYMMSTGETSQCEALGLKKFGDILKHPSRFDKNSSSNISYNLWLKFRWGIIASFDFILSLLILNSLTRAILLPFLKSDTKRSLKLYSDCDAIYVKGGGFLHDYSKGMVGLYTIYYQTYHIRLALKMKKNVYIMPNSFGPFKNSLTVKMINKILDKCKLSTAREDISAKGISNGLGRDLPLYPDLGFFLPAAKKSWAMKYLKNTGLNVSKEKFVGITVRPYRFYNSDNPTMRYMEYKKAFARFINYLHENNYKTMLTVHTRAENDHENDERCVAEIYEMLSNNARESVFIINDNNLDCHDLKALYGLCDYVVGTRFHSVIFAITQNVPCIAITYGGNKGEGIMNDMGLGDFAIDIEKVTFDNLREKFTYIIKNTESVDRKIKRYLLATNQKYKELVDAVRKA